MAKGPGGFSVGRVSIQVVPDTSEFRKKLVAELKKETKGIKVEIPVDLDSAKAVAQLKALDTILKRIDGRQINIGTNVNSKGDLQAVSKDLSKVAKSAQDAAGGFFEFGRTGAIVLGIVLLIAPALALIATLIAGLPSLLFAFGAAAGAVALGFEGIKKAAAGFAPTVDRLKKSLSATFTKELTQAFLDLNKLAPVLDSGLNSIAVSLSGIVNDFVKFVTTGQGMAQVNEILKNTATFFNQLRPAFADGFSALFLLASEASKEFGSLAATFNRFAAGFKNAVLQVTADGTLPSALRNLNLVLDSLLDAFNQFFVSGLKAMTVLGGPITVLLSGFTQLIVALMPILTAVSKLVFNVFGEAFKQLAPVVQAITPAIQTLGELLGTLLTGALKAVGPLLVQIATILNNVLLRVFSAIAPFIPTIVDFFTQLAQIVGAFLVAAFQALSPFLSVFLKFVTDLLLALAPLMPVLLEFATAVLKSIADVLRNMAPDLVRIGQELFPKLLQIINDLVPVVISFLKTVTDVLPALTGLAILILDIVIPVFEEMLRIIDTVWPEMKIIIQSAIEHIKGLINLVMGVINGDWERAWTGIKQILSAAWEGFKAIVRLGISAILEFFVALPMRIVNSFLGLPSSLAQSGRAMMQGLIDGIKSMGQAVVNSALSIVKQVRDLLPFSPAKTGPFSGRGYTLYSGRALMNDWAKGIEQGAPNAVRAVEDAMAATQTGMDLNAAVAAEGFGDLNGQIMSALSGWDVVIDANGITKLVNKTNQRNSRR